MFADPQFQSTLERTHLTHEDSGQVDPDGIRHSFERSTTSIGLPTTSPFGMATFRVRQNTSNVDITGEGDSKDDEGREGVKSGDIVAEGNDDPGQNRSDTLDPPQLERPNRSSFSAFLARSKSPVPATQAQSTSNAALSTTLFCSTPPTRFVTISELKALERRFQVLVSSAAGSNGAQISNLPPTTGANPIASVTFGTQRPVTPENLASVSTINQAVRRIATRGKNKRRGRPTPAARDSNSEEVASRCQPGTSIRPRPRLQLNVQMFKKHPVFKFFVTAPVDSLRDPHKWRCRVCQQELSLKTRGALEILSHYRTEAHLIREHRIRMETPDLPLYRKNEQELVGLALEEAREKAELEFPIAPVLGECYLLPEQRELPADTDALDPSSVVCSQIRVLLTGLQHSGNYDSLCTLWNNLGLEIRGPVRVPQFNWKPERVFVSICCVACFPDHCSVINSLLLFY